MNSACTSPAPFSFSPDVKLWLGGFTLLGGLLGLLFTGQYNLLFGFLFIGVLIVISIRDKILAILLTMAYLHLLGDIRRMANMVSGVPTVDMLLLVGPAIALLIALPILPRLKLPDRLSKAMLYLSVVMVLEIFNPRQGGLAVGFSGAIFFLVPTLWFWIGRHYGTPEVLERLLYNVLFPVATAAAILGLCQNFIGFTPWEQAWIDVQKQHGGLVNLGSSIRAFGFFVSPAEYATTMAIAAGATAAAWFGRRRAWVLATPILIAAMILASGRTVVFKLALALAVVWAMRHGKRVSAATIVRGIAALVVLLAAIAYTASRFAPTDNDYSNRTAAQEALTHQASGLANPLDSKHSTAGLHGALFLDGIVAGFTYPIGRGLGANTTAANKYGGASDTYSSEIDISDMFLDLGVIGGLIYLYIVFATLRATIEYTYAAPLGVALPAVAIVFSLIGSWMEGGQYSNAALVFFIIGATVNKRRQSLVSHSISASESCRPLAGKPQWAS